MRVLGGAEDLILVVLEGLDPRGDVGGVLFGVVRNAALCGKEDARQFGAQLFFGIVGIAKPVAFIEGLAVQTSRVTAPVGKLVKSGSVIICGAFESLLPRKVDGIFGAL